MDAQELEILTYRAFRDRQARLEWEKRLRAYECRDSLAGAAGEEGPKGLWWIRSAGEWVSDRLWRRI
jgi:hypothetical protein